MRTKITDEQWVKIKHKYLYTGATYDSIARSYNTTRQRIMRNLFSRFPNVDFKKRKEEERVKREKLSISNAEEKRVARELRVANVEDAMDRKHLDVINQALDMAMASLNNGTLKPKDIKDVKDLINLERDIAGKAKSVDKVIIISPEYAEYDLPEIIDGDFEEIKTPQEEG